MITEYFRPASIEEALALLSEDNQKRKPLGGGTSISRQQIDDFSVVDLQECGLEKIHRVNKLIQVGAMAQLASLLEHPDVHPEIKRAIRIDSNENVRNIATLGGWIISSSGRSILSTLLLALDSTLTWEPNTNRTRLGDWLPLRKQDSPDLLLTEIEWGVDPYLAFESVARSPMDQPTLIVAVAQWHSGRTRIGLGGYGSESIIAMDGSDQTGAELACRDAYFNAGDQWASAEFRREVAARLVLRCIERLYAIKEREA